MQEETKPSAGRKRLIHQIAKQIRSAQLQHETIELARRAVVPHGGEAGDTVLVEKVDSLASLKQKLAALLVTDTKQFLANVLAFRGKTSALPGEDELSASQDTQEATHG